MLNQIMVSLDCIYDTRLAVINKVNIQAVPDILLTYHNRIDDNFDKLSNGLIEMSLYHEAYKQRDIGTIKSSYRTGILEAMKGIIAQTMTGPWVDVEVTINVYPYNLTDEVKDALAEGVGHALNCRAKCTSISNELLTPSVLDGWDCYISYDFHKWLETNGDALIKKRIRTTCFYPRLLFGDGKAIGPHGKELTGKALAKAESMDKFASLELLLSQVVSVNALPVSLFSAVQQRFDES